MKSPWSSLFKLMGLSLLTAMLFQAGAANASSPCYNDPNNRLFACCEGNDNIWYMPASGYCYCTDPYGNLISNPCS
jgi:hypothetical protein